MNIYKLKLYDELINKTSINIFTLSKDKNGIYLSNFNPSNKNHRYFLQVARTVSMITNKQIYLDMKLFSYLKFKIFTKSKDVLKGKIENGINIDEVLSFMSNSLQIDSSIFGKIYEEYWRKNNDWSIYRRRHK